MGEDIWLGYSGLTVNCAAISAVVHYQNAWDRRIVQSYGAIPPGIQSVVLLEDGRALPAQRTIEELRRQLATWQARQPS